MDLCSIGGSVYHGYMCILLCVRLIGCNSVAWIYGQFGGSICHGYMCIRLYMKLNGCNGVSWIYGWLEVGVHLPWVYVHSSICETSWVYQCSIDLWSIWGCTCHGYMCILQYMKLIGCNGFAWIYAWIGQSISHWYKCILLYVWLMGKHRSIVIWGSVCHGYMCSLLYMKCIGCTCIMDLWLIGSRCPFAMGICAFFYMWNFLGLSGA